MVLKINGEEQSVENDVDTIIELLMFKDVKSPDMVTVQLNGAFVRKEDYPETSLHENDAVDFLYFMGGGSIK